MIESHVLLGAYQTARRELLARRGPAGYWVGELSASALSTATAVSALSLYARAAHDDARRDVCRQLAGRGIDWLARHQNEDGGWGDTDKSFSNIATTMLVAAAFRLAEVAEHYRDLLARADAYIAAQDGVGGVTRRYGSDRTFAAPILTNAALAGMVAWRDVPALPFELASLPPRFWRILRLQVVSYAIPALVAIGQARFMHHPPANPIARLVRRLSLGRGLQTLERMQPASGGYLEAVPLTSFVVMSLASTQRADHAVTRRGVTFLLHSMRGDGSWPIDTNLATWVTSGAVGALAAASGDVGALGCLDWLLGCQHDDVHPYTGAAPGGWGWSDLSGAVPDADDTAGSLLALHVLRASSPEPSHARIDAAAGAAARWLLDLQNDDGGWPTFCRGWGRLPFDRSGADLTAHALRALSAWLRRCDSPSAVEDEPATDDGGADGSITMRAADEPTVAIDRAQATAAIARGLKYLERQQRADGSWVPLWFGNQYFASEENPTYGTARVVLAYRDLGLLESIPAQRGLHWLANHAGPDGGWGSDHNDTTTIAGGHSSVEETALAVEALASRQDDPALRAAFEDGLRWLVGAVQSGRYLDPSPIGFYFAKLWYYERMYPLVFTVSALGATIRSVLTTNGVETASATS